jgi:hypothetical protein
MSKKRVAPAVSPTEAPRTVPLKDITITWPVEGRDEPLSVSGETVGEILEYAARACPNVPYFLSPDLTGFKLEGLAKMCHELAGADLESCGSLDTLFHGLGYLLNDCAARLGARHELAGYRLRQATVTIAAAPAAEAAR